MTRYARSEGSKSSNKRIVEDPTPWDELKKKKMKCSPKEIEAAETPEPVEKRKRKKEKAKPETMEKTNPQPKEKSNKESKETPNPQPKEKTNPQPKGATVIYSQTEEDYKGNFISEPIEDLEQSSDSEEKKKELDTHRKKKKQKLKKEKAAEIPSNVDKIHGFITENGQRYKKFKNGVKKPWIDIHYEENDVMTQYNKFFVLKEVVPELDALKKNLENAGESEKVIKNKLMTKERRAHHKLRVYLMYEQINKIKGNEKQKWTQRTRQIAKFDGYSVKPESAARLHHLRDELKKTNLSQEELWNIVKLERRKEEKELKREKKVICFNCREPGHTVSQCSQTQTAHICYKCGSTEHTSKNCFKQGETYTHAQCFHCSKAGHLARDCPDNPKGMYPDGGSCRKCDSIHHLVKDCPKSMQKNGNFAATVKARKPGENPEEMDF